MRILIVSTWFPDADRPDVAPFNVAHAEAIARNHDVRVVHARLGGSGPIREEEYAGLPVTRVPIDPRWPVATARSLNALRRLARGADVVHSMAFSTLGVLAPLYPMIGDRWVHTEHWSVLAGADHGRVLTAAKSLLRLPRGVSAVSTALSDALRPSARRRSGVDVVPNVIVDHFGSREQPSWSPLELVAVGALIERKRPLLAVDTVAELVESGEPATLTWIGDGPQRDEVARRAAELGVADRVTLVGAVAPHEVPAHLAGANLFFLPTRSETFLVAAAEALACGRPVVLPDLPCVADYVTDGNGVLVDSDNAAAFAAAIRTARDRFAGVPADTIRATVIPRFSADTIAEKFDEFYSHLEK